MMLYRHPVSTTCRPIGLLIDERRRPVVEQLAGEHPFSTLDPNELGGACV